MSRRVIDELRRMYPGRWTFQGPNHVWRHEDGWTVTAVSMTILGIDGPRDDVFRTEYRRDDTMEILRLHQGPR